MYNINNPLSEWTERDIAAIQKPEEAYLVANLLQENFPGLSQLALQHAQNLEAQREHAQASTRDIFDQAAAAQSPNDLHSLASKILPTHPHLSRTFHDLATAQERANPPKRRKRRRRRTSNPFPRLRTILLLSIPLLLLILAVQNSTSTSHHNPKTHAAPTTQLTTLTLHTPTPSTTTQVVTFRDLPQTPPPTTQLTLEKAWRALEQNNPPLALTYFLQITRNRPHLADGWYGLGLTYRAFNQHENALRALLSAYRLSPHDPEIAREFNATHTLFLSPRAK